VLGGPGRPAVLRLQINRADSTWEVRFAAKWRLQQSSHSGGTFVLGPLAFVRPFAHRSLVLQADDRLYGLGDTAPSAVRDEELVALDLHSWAHRVVVNTSADIGESVRLVALEVRRTTHDELAFASDVEMCPLNAVVRGVALRMWEGAFDAAVLRSLTLPLPPDVETPAAAQDVLHQEELVLRPFGCTKLRAAVVPLLILGASNTEAARMDSM